MNAGKLNGCTVECMKKGGRAVELLVQLLCSVCRYSFTLYKGTCGKFECGGFQRNKPAEGTYIYIYIVGKLFVRILID